MNKPTEEQIKKFWEWCGWHIGQIKDGYNVLYRPDGSAEASDYSLDNLGQSYPPIDLNNLFKWAVPKAFERLPSKIKKVALVNDAVCDSTENKCSVALALFWNIWKVIDGEK